MRIAGGEITIRLRRARIFLDREEQFRHRFIEAPSEEMRAAYRSGRSAHTGAGAEAVRGFDDARIAISSWPAQILR